MKLTSCPKFCLAKPAMDIPFGDVVRLTEGPPDILVILDIILMRGVST